MTTLSTFYSGSMSTVMPWLVAYCLCTLLLTSWQAGRFISKYSSQSPRYLLQVVGYICGWELIHAALTIGSARFYYTHPDITFKSKESLHWGFISMYFATACSVAYIQILLVRLSSQSPGFCNANWMYAMIFAFIGWTFVGIFYPVFRFQPAGELVKFAVACASCTTPVDLILAFRLKDMVDHNRFVSNIMQERALTIVRIFLFTAMTVRAIWGTVVLVIWGSSGRYSTLSLLAMDLAVVEFLGNLYAPMFLYALNIFGIPPQEMIDSPEGEYVNEIIPHHSRSPSPVELSTIEINKQTEGVHRRTTG